MFKKNGFLQRPSGSGRPRKIASAQTERKIVRIVKQDPKISAVQIAKQLREDSIVNVHPQTIRNFLYSKEYAAYSPRKKPYLSARNIKKRIEYAKSYVGKPEEFGSLLFLLTSPNSIYLGLTVAGLYGEGKVQHLILQT